MSNMAVWNNPNYLEVTGCYGWFRVLCVLCGKEGELINKWGESKLIWGIRDPWVCDNCKLVKEG